MDSNRDDNGRFVKGHKHRKVTIERIRRKATGRHHTEETRKKISASKKGSTPWNKYLIKINCQQCSKSFMPWASRTKYCSRKCFHKSREGIPTWNKGLSPLKPFLAGENNPSWKGDNVGYSGLHKWVYKKLGKPKKCEHCEESKKTLHWANKSKKYKRRVDDWMSLCVSCHRHYDK